MEANHERLYDASEGHHLTTSHVACMASDGVFPCYMRTTANPYVRYLGARQHRAIPSAQVH